MALIPVLAGLLVALLGVVAQLHDPVFDDAAWGHALSQALGVGVACTFVALLWQRLRPARRLAAHVSHDDGHIGVDQHGAFKSHALAESRQGWFAPLEGGGYEVCLMLRGDRVLTIVAEDLDEARWLLRTAGVDPERHAQQIALCDAGPWTPGLRWRRWLRIPAYAYGPAVFMAVMGMHGASPRVGLAILGAGCAIGALVALDAMARIVHAPRVTVGNEGLLVEGFFHRRFIPITHIRRADADERGVVLTLRDDTVILPIGVDRDGAGLNDPAAQDARRDALMELLRRAVGEGAAPPASVDAVARQGRALDAWQKELREMLGHDYRTASYTAEALVAVVSSATALREQRIGAAMALAHHPDPKIIAKLRVAIDTCADPALQAAIEAAAEAELSDAELSRALAVDAAE